VTGRVRLAIVASLLLAVVTAGKARARCGDPPVTSPESPAVVTWERVEDPSERRILDLWCAAVGPPVSAGAGRAHARPVDRIALVSWNVHVGGGGLRALLADLRSGRLTGGGSVSEFVVLVQEALRVGDAVPEHSPDGAGSGRRILESPPDGERVGIDELARSEGLFAWYAPSMRNGLETQEDRGNAILSTLPLSELAAIELPLERQRRIAVAATVRGSDRAGVPWSLRVVNVHLDNWSGWGRFFESFGSGRARQVRRIIELFSDVPAVVVGGDLNTWFGQLGEPAIAELRASFPLPVETPPGATHAAFGGIANRRVDYLAFRLPDGWSADYAVGVDKRHSDHTPLVGEVVIGAGR